LSAAFRRTVGTTAVAFVCLGVWVLSPLYPDEFAYRQELGRVVADRSVVYGLYEMCQSNMKMVPLILEPIAWVLSQTMRILSPLEMRVLSFAAVLAVVFTAVRQTGGSRNPAAGFLVLASFVGIAGSGLIFARYEFALELQLLSCLVATARVARPKSGVLGDFVAMIGLILAAALSVWSHAQGLLLVPLTSYALLQLAVRRFGSAGSIAGVASLVLFVPLALTVHHSVCPEHPQIEAFWRTLGFDASNLGARHLAEMMYEGAHMYVQSFLYAASFPLGYIPGVDSTSVLMKVTNTLISFVVVGLGGFALCIPPVVLFRCFKLFRVNSVRVASAELFEKNQTMVIATLITVPVFILFLYDAKHAFYRNFYMNHFLSVAACLALAPLTGRLSARLTTGTSAIVGILVGQSLILNTTLFLPPLWNGYETPATLSVFRSWSQVKRDTGEVARQCKMNLANGRIVVDDLTQAGVFSSPMTIPLTYLTLQANLIGINVHDAAIALRANYAILRCPDFTHLGVLPQGKVGEICCYSFH